MKEVAVFGGGCFWCTEAVFSRLKGVSSVMPGYAEDAEVIRIEFDPQIISYQTLLDIFFDIHNPASLNRQGNDIGTQYRSIILYTTQEQKRLADNARKEIPNAVTEIKSLDKFYTAEEYHQKYYDKNPELPYCSLVIAPKLKHLEEKYASLIK